MCSNYETVTQFDRLLDSEQNNDEVEVVGEMFCELVLLAMEAD